MEKKKKRKKLVNLFEISNQAWGRARTIVPFATTTIAPTLTPTLSQKHIKNSNLRVLVSLFCHVLTNFHINHAVALNNLNQPLFLQHGHALSFVHRQLLELFLNTLNKKNEIKRNENLICHYGTVICILPTAYAYQLNQPEYECSH